MNDFLSDLDITFRRDERTHDHASTNPVRNSTASRKTPASTTTRRSVGTRRHGTVSCRGVTATARLGRRNRVIEAVSDFFWVELLVRVEFAVSLLVCRRSVTVHRR